MRFGAGRVLRRRLCGRDLLGSGDRGAAPAGGRRRETLAVEREWSDGEMGERQERCERWHYLVCEGDSPMIIPCYHLVFSFCRASAASRWAWRGPRLFSCSRKARDVGPADLRPPGVCARCLSTSLEIIVVPYSFARESATIAHLGVRNTIYNSLVIHTIDHPFRRLAPTNGCV